MRLTLALLAALLTAGILPGCTLLPPGDVTDTVPSTPSAGSDTSGGGTTISSGSSSGTPADEFSGCDEPAEAAAWQAEVLALVNHERALRGLAALQWNGTLAAQAEQYACEMIYYDFFDHVNPVTGSELPDRSAEFGYVYSAIGENLAAGQQSPVQVVRAWMDSAGHRANILNEYFTEIGVGVRTGGQYGIYWVQEFGRPLSAAYQRVFVP
jgi:uncharacterized protein YkwD